MPPLKTVYVCVLLVLYVEIFLEISIYICFTVLTSRIQQCQPPTSKVLIRRIQTHYQILASTSHISPSLPACYKARGLTILIRLKEILRRHLPGSRIDLHTNDRLLERPGGRSPRDGEGLVFVPKAVAGHVEEASRVVGGEAEAGHPY